MSNNNSSENTTKTFNTSDLFLAAYLKGLDFEIQDIKKDKVKTIFVFKDNEKRKQLVLDFYNGKGSIEPLKFVRAWKELKGLVYNA